MLDEQKSTSMWKIWHRTEILGDVGAPVQRNGKNYRRRYTSLTYCRKEVQSKQRRTHAHEAQELTRGFRVLRRHNFSHLQFNSTTSSTRRCLNWSTGTHTPCRCIRPTTGSSPYTNGRSSVRRRHAKVHIVGTSTNDSLEPSPTSTGSTRCTSCRSHQARVGSRQGHEVTGSRRRGCTSAAEAILRSHRVGHPSRLVSRYAWKQK